MDFFKLFACNSDLYPLSLTLFRRYRLILTIFGQGDRPWDVPYANPLKTAKPTCTPRAFMKIFLNVRPVAAAGRCTTGWLKSSGTRNRLRSWKRSPSASNVTITASPLNNPAVPKPGTDNLVQKIILLLNWGCVPEQDSVLPGQLLPWGVGRHATSLIQPDYFLSCAVPLPAAR